MVIQPSLFAAPDHVVERRQHVPRITARNAKSQLQKLRVQLASAQADLRDQEYNLEVVKMHQRASRDGRIDLNWWEGAMRFGIWHFEVDTEYRIGSYPIKVVRWLRHLNFTLNAQCHAIQQTIAELMPKVGALECLLNEAPQAQ
jgi:hypothetical protein